MTNAPLPSSFEWSSLLAKIRRKEVIPVLGSELLDYDEQARPRPVMAQWATELAKRSELHPSPFGGFLLTESIQTRGWARANLRDMARSIWSEHPEWAIPSKVHRQLADIDDLRYFVSTTPDDRLTRALAEMGAEPLSGEFSPDASEVQDRPPPRPKGLSFDERAVLHLFGSFLSDTSWALTDGEHLEYLHALQRVSRSQYIDELLADLRKHTLLFIGCRFPDWFNRFLTRTLPGKRLDAETYPSTFAGEHVTPDLRVFLLAQRAISVPGHPSAAEFVDELHRRYFQRDLGPSYAPAVAPAGAQAARDLGPSYAQAVAASVAQAADAAPVGAVDVRRDPGSGSQPIPSRLAPHVFISFARPNEAQRRDQQPIPGDQDLAIAREVAALMRARKFRVFLDETDFRQGDNLASRTSIAMRSCALFFPIVTPYAVSRSQGYFRQEWTSATLRNRGIAPNHGFVRPIVVGDVPYVDLFGGEYPPPEEWYNLLARRWPTEAERMVSDALETLTVQVGDVA